MAVPELGKMVGLDDPRKVWGNEATDFTPWLAKEENIAELSNAIGIDITVNGTEQNVGDFSADIVGVETGTDKVVIIENQLEATNHDHLGKIITYAAGTNASYVIWVVKEARPEHQKAIEWLNENTVDGISFFLCEIKLYQIDSSRPAPIFIVKEQPNDWAREVRSVKGDLSETELKRAEYWDAFQEYAFAKPEIKKIFRRRSGSLTDHWLTYYINRGDCHITLLQQRKKHRLEIQFYIPDSKELFHDLYESKDEIEQAAGEKYDWEELPGRKASYAMAFKKNVNLDDKNAWNDQFDWLIDQMLRMEKAFKPFL